MESTHKTKMDWMYKDGNTVDREEYLLGRAIDKAFEQSEFGAKIENERDGLPPSIFSSSGSNVQVDIFRKKQEDPLEAIRQKELELRKQLLKNPIKLKKLQNMLKEQEKSKVKKNKNKRKKGKHSRSTSPEDKDGLNKILASKYLKLIKKYGLEKLKEINADSSSESEENTSEGTKRDKVQIKHSKGVDSKEKKSRREDHEKCHRSNNREKSSGLKREEISLWGKELNKDHSRPKHSDLKRSYEKYRSRKSQRTSSESESTDSSSGDERLEQRNKSKTDSYSEDKRRRAKLESDESKSAEKNYGLLVPQNFSSLHKENVHSGRTEQKLPGKKTDPKPWKRPERTKLSEEEKERKRKEMMDNAKWRDEIRENNVKRYREEEDKEKKKEKEYDSDFLRKQMSTVISVHGSVEERIKSNINCIQRTKMALDKKFTKR